MKPHPLDATFFARPVLSVAPDLLGKYLAYRTDAGEGAVMITEVEAYDGEADLACHASKGRTKRTEVLYGTPGTLYVYLCYGIHWLVNVVTDEPEYPAAVLIRGVEDIAGPGRVTKALGIDGRYNAARALRPLCGTTGVWFEDHGTQPDPVHIMRTPRIGMACPQPWAEKPYRFVLSM